jgi:hypothetical protein
MAIGHICFGIMLKPTNRHIATTVLSRSSAVNNLNHLLQSKSQVLTSPIRASPNFNKDRLLFRASEKLPLSFFTVDELKQLRHIYTFMIDRLKQRLKNCFFLKQNWRSSFIQNSRKSIGLRSENNWRLKKRNLLLDVYQLTFREQINIGVVYLVVCEFLEEYHLIDEFGIYITDPLTLAISSAMEYARFCEQHSAEFTNS